MRRIGVFAVRASATVKIGMHARSWIVRRPSRTNDKFRIRLELGHQHNPQAGTLYGRRLHKVWSGRALEVG